MTAQISVVSELIVPVKQTKVGELKDLWLKYDGGIGSLWSFQQWSRNFFDV